MSLDALEKRVALLEMKVAQLVGERERNGNSSQGNWIDQVTGVFENIPEFDEVVRLGREIRAADRPMEDA